MPVFTDEKTRLEARELLIRARLYRLFAFVTAAVGLVIFLILYFRTIEGRLLEALSEPQTVLIVVIPFLPAVVLSFMADKARKNFVNRLHTHLAEKGQGKSADSAGSDKTAKG